MVLKSPPAARSGALALVAALALSACGSSSDPAALPPPGPPPVFLAGPSLAPSPMLTTPLAARVEAQTDLPSVLELTLSDGVSSWTVVPPQEYGTDHEVAVLGVRPDTVYTVSIAARSQSGGLSVSVDQPFVTAALPADFPPIEVTALDPSKVEPGVTMLNLSVLGGAGVANSYLVIVDEAGEVVWFHQPFASIGDSRRLSNGNLLYNANDNLIREIDMLGVVQAEWFADQHTPGGGPAGAIAMPYDTFHHEVFEIVSDVPGGESTFVTLATELRTFTNYPADVIDPTQTEASAEVVGDIVVEFQRDGTVLREYPLLDVLDPDRMTYDSLADFWAPTYGADSRDWSHGNAVIHDPTDDGFILSLRHQDVVFEISRQTGDIRWLLGDPERWTLPWANATLTPDPAPMPFPGGGAPTFEWNYHQHAPMLTKGGGLLLFDNGNGRAIPPTPELDPVDRYSRAVEYVIDEANLTVRQEWAYGGPQDAWYSAAVGDADELPTTGNVLITDGFRFVSEGHAWARVLEVTRDDPAEVVLELTVLDDAAVDPVSWIAYRAERLQGLYP